MLCFTQIELIKMMSPNCILGFGGHNMSIFGVKTISQPDSGTARSGYPLQKGRAFCFRHAGKYVWGECRVALSVSRRARGGVLSGRMERFCWGMQRVKRAGGGVEACFPQMGCAPDAGWLASDCEDHRPRCPCRQKSGVPQERGCPFPGDGGVRTSVSLL